MDRSIQKSKRVRLQSMTPEELSEKLKRSEEALAEGRLMTQAEVETYFQNRRDTENQKNRHAELVSASSNADTPDGP